MDNEDRRAFIEKDLTTEELIEELDRRLGEQGFEPKNAGIKILVEYLREGWSLVALPPDLADRFDGVAGLGNSIHSLAAELRRRIMQTEGQQ